MRGAASTGEGQGARRLQQVLLLLLKGLRAGVAAPCNPSRGQRLRVRSRGELFCPCLRPISKNVITSSLGRRGSHNNSA